MLQCLLLAQAMQHSLTIQAQSAYLQPADRAQALVSSEGVTNWMDDQTLVVFYVILPTPGYMNIKLCTSAPLDQTTTFRVKFDRYTSEQTVAGKGLERSDYALLKDKFHNVGYEWYQRIEVKVHTSSAKPFAILRGIILQGEAIQNAVYLTARKSAATAHLWYRDEGDVMTRNKGGYSWFYNELTPQSDPKTTFYMSNGWVRGTLGLINTEVGKQLIFSVWNSNGFDTILLAKGEAVKSGRFEDQSGSSGMRSQLQMDWKLGRPYKLLVGARKRDLSHTDYAAYYFKDGAGWELISVFRVANDYFLMNYLYSFVQDIGLAGDEQRVVVFSNQWVQADGKWQEITNSYFTVNEIGVKERLDHFAEVKQNGFLLSSGGFVPGFSGYGANFTRQTTQLPEQLKTLPSIAKQA